MTQLDLPLGLITVHCFTCPYSVTGASPAAAHDAMERHYSAAHGPLVERLAAGLR